MQTFQNILSGKRAVIVGPAKAIVESNHGELIESFDVVVRVNNQWPIPAELRRHLGKRMDILYHCCNGDYPINRFFIEDFLKTKMVCVEAGLEKFFLERQCKTYQIPILDVTSLYIELKKETGHYPTTGLVAIKHLLQQPLKELYVTGFTFLKTPYYDGYLGAGAVLYDEKKVQNTGKFWGHEVDSQLAYFKKSLLSDSRVRIDKELENILIGA